MTNQEIIEVVKAAEAGETIEFREHGKSEWWTTISPAWNFFAKDYRIKRKPIKGYAVASPRSGEVLSIWKTREAAERICKGTTWKVIELEEVK